MKNKKIIFICLTALLVIAVIFLSLSNNKKDDNKINQLINKKATIKSIKFDDKKINIYFFWGDGCPHCKEEYEFWNSIIDKYKDKINCIYGMEVWNNKKNAKSLKEFSEFKNEKVKGVPYTIIGDKTFIGFDKSMKKQMENKVNELYNAGNNYDIYKEMTKDNNDEKDDKQKEDK